MALVRAVSPSRAQLLLLGGPLALAVMLSATASYLVRTATALAAAYVLLRAARRYDDGMVLARRMLAMALLTGALSGLMAAGYLAVVGHTPPTGWVSDWVYLGYAPCAVLGTLVLPRGSRTGGWSRVLADGSVAAGSLWYLSMVLFVDAHNLGNGLAGSARIVTLAYPLMPAFVVAVMLSALPGVQQQIRPFLLRAAAGMALLGFSDAAFAVASWQGHYEPTSWIAGVNQLGLFALLAAALVGSRPGARSAGGDDAHDAHDGHTPYGPRAAGPATGSVRDVLVIGAPYAPLALALVAAAFELAHGRGVPVTDVPALLLIGGAVVVRHIASTRETGRLVSRIVAREQQARTQAMTDALTGLANRTSFVEALDRALSQPELHPVAVALLDLNDFKDINDTHGHDTGDEVLRSSAERLRAAVPSGHVARIGGDEFAAFVTASPDDGRGLGDRIAGAFADVVTVGNRAFVVRPSVGVVVDERPAGAARPGDGSHLLAHADVAMYEAKRDRSSSEVPVAVLTGRARASAAATIRIRDEVSTPQLEQFRLEYQPVVDLQTGAITGAEALLRWRHPEYGEISPAVFVPLSERVGSIGLLGEFVLDTALADAASWASDANVGVNVSPSQLTDPAFAAAVFDRLRAARLPATRLTLEVTEEALVHDIDSVAETISALRAGGVSVAVDDFGTGYSSLRYLRRFDADIVKVDREFVQASSSEPRTDALVRSVVSMAQALDLVCVAEGIETLEQLALMRSHGCPLGQGFLLDRPMPATALAQLIAEGHVYPVAVGQPQPSTPVTQLRSLR